MAFLNNNRVSPSELKVWKSSKNSYIKQYILGEKFLGNRYTEFGLQVHKDIERGFSEDTTLDTLITLLPRQDQSEFHLETETKINKQKIKLHGYIDSYGNDIIIDYKTGKAGAWTQKKVEKDLQFDFYAYMHKLTTGRDATILAVHIITEEINGNIFLTGDFDIYEYKPTDFTNLENTLNEFILWTTTNTLYLEELQQSHSSKPSLQEQQ